MTTDTGKNLKGSQETYDRTEKKKNLKNLYTVGVYLYSILKIIKF